MTSIKDSDWHVKNILNFFFWTLLNKIRKFCTCIVALHVKFKHKQKTTVEVTAETVWQVKNRRFPPSFQPAWEEELFTKENQFSCTVCVHITAELVSTRESVQLYCVRTYYSWTGSQWFVCTVLYIQLCAFWFQPSAFSLQPSAFSLQPSSFSLQPSAFSLQPSANNVLGVVRLQNKRLQKKRLHDDDRDWVPMQNDWVPMNDGKSGLLRWGTPT